MCMRVVWVYVYRMCARSSWTSWRGQSFFSFTLLRSSCSSTLALGSSPLFKDHKLFRSTSGRVHVRAAITPPSAGERQRCPRIRLLLCLHDIRTSISEDRDMASD
eukprot:TRINITY_DN28532_c0_g1_i1.p1 TRINITY_DN28532_c0_g1~~TRINITY_DN28532_c0_g1_i1.p1  ORF type:complete len:105 (-),score=6.46 TRINITY_DN28532_c0_g1_i1:365-679(-)